VSITKDSNTLRTNTGMLGDVGADSDADFFDFECFDCFDSLAFGSLFVIKTAADETVSDGRTSATKEERRRGSWKEEKESERLGGGAWV